MEEQKSEPGGEVSLRGEDDENTALALGSDLVVSELLDKFRASDHFSDRRSCSPIRNGDHLMELNRQSRIASSESQNYGRWESNEMGETECD